MSIAAEPVWSKPEGWTWVAVAAEIGITPDSLYRWRHPAKAREYARRDNAKRREVRRAWNLENRWREKEPCPRCHGPMKKGAKQCRDCLGRTRY